MKYNEYDMDMALTEYVVRLLGDWHAYRARSGMSNYNPDRGYTYERGRNYIKCVKTERGVVESVHSFIVIKATKGFKVGDILKAATFKAPATNFARGNVLDPTSYEDRISWAGAH